MNYRHGKKHSRVYNIWTGMMSRCLNPNAPAYSRYGGRGVSICARWQDFKSFYEDMGDPPDGMSIERNDNNVGYEPGNCRWATRTEQNRNKSNNRLITVDGETASVATFADRYGLKPHTVRARLSSGWNDADAVKTPLVSKRKGIPRGARIYNFGATHGVVFDQEEAFA